MSREGLDALRARVHGDPDLARRLHDLEPDAFAQRVAHVAEELGLAVGAHDVDEALHDGRRAWILRWIR